MYHRYAVKCMHTGHVYLSGSVKFADGGPCIPLASRILKDRSKPWQGTARANPYVFHGGK